MDDEPELPLGAGTWTRIAMAADWLSKRKPSRETPPQTPTTGYPRHGYETAYRPIPDFPGAGWRQLPPETQAQPVTRLRTAAQHEDHASFELQPRLQSGKGGIAFVGGAGDEHVGKRVLRAYRRYVGAGLPAAYFSESQGPALAKWLDDNAGNVKAVYAHSYGAGTAAEQFASGHGKGVPLYTVAGVSRVKPDFEAVEKTARFWVNYNSTSELKTRGDILADWFGEWEYAPENYAIQINLPYSHEDIMTRMAPAIPIDNIWT